MNPKQFVKAYLPYAKETENSKYWENSSNHYNQL